MSFIKRNYLLFLIILLAIYLRFNIELFLPGYCFDEMAMVSVAKQNFPLEILKQAALQDYHAPLYYLIIHFFTYFPKEWLLLRFFNLTLSIINLVVFYLIGKSLKNKNLGLILALFFCVNHLFISTVSFVKFYCMCILIVSLSLLFFIKSLKNEKHLLTLGIINAFYIYSATLGFIFVFIEYLVLYLNNKKITKNFLKSASISAIGFVLYLPILIYQSKIAFNNIISPHGAYGGAYLPEILGIFNDYISPFLNYCCNYDTMSASEIFYIFLSELLKHKFDITMLAIWVVFSLIPVLIAMYLNYKSLSINKKYKLLAILGYLYLAAFIILIKLQVLGLVTIYFYPFGLIFIILAASGTLNIKNNKMKLFMLCYLIIIQLIVSNVYPLSKRDAEKDKYFYCLEQYFQKETNKNKLYIMTAGGRFLKLYYKDKNIISFDYEQMGASHNHRFINMIYGSDFSKNVNKYNIQNEMKKVIKKSIKSTDFENYVRQNVIEKLEKNQELTVAIYTDASPFILSEQNIGKILNSKNYRPIFTDAIKLLNTDLGYENTNISDMFDVVSSYSNIYLFEILDANLKRTKIEQYIRTEYFDYKKIFDEKNIPQSTIWIAQHANKGWVFITYVKQ